MGLFSGLAKTIRLVDEPPAYPGPTAAETELLKVEIKKGEIDFEKVEALPEPEIAPEKSARLRPKPKVTKKVIPAFILLCFFRFKFFLKRLISR